MRRCLMMPQRSNPYSIKGIISNLISRLENKKAEVSLGFFVEYYLLSLVRKVLHLQISRGVCLISFLLFGRSQPDERLP